MLRLLQAKAIRGAGEDDLVFVQLKVDGVTFRHVFLRYAF